MANGGRIDFTVGFKTDKTGLNDLKNQLNEISKMSATQIKVENPSLNMNEAMSAMQKVRAAIDEIRPALDNAFDTTTGIINLEKLNNSLNKMNLAEIQNRFNAIGPKGQKALLDISKAALTTNVALKQTSNFLDKMGQTLINTVKWSISSSAINTFAGAVQQAYGYVQHLDTSLNDIRIVTGKSADEMDRFAEKANKAAKSLGASTTDYTEAALIYYQQGLSDEESQARAETTLKAANVTGQTGREVSEQLTAVWNGYKVSAEETELYVDKLAAVAATTASDLEELSTGMSKVASAANAMGVDVDQLNGMLSTIISVTRQAPETAGTALKTIFARIEDLKISGEDEDGVKLGEVSSTLDEVGVHIMDVNGDIRDLGEVIEEVASKWNTWTNAQQNAIAQAMAGKRQYNNLLALFNNWDMYSSAVDTSRNSIGTLQRQQDIYMESTEAHLQELRTEWEDLYDSLLSSSDINSILDGLTAILDKVTSIIDSIGGGKTVLTGLIALITTKFSKQIAQAFTPLITNMNNAKQNAEVLDSLLKNINYQKDNNIISGKAAERMTDVQKEMSQYWDLMSEEQINASQETIREIGEWETKRENIQETTKALQGYIGKLSNASKVQKEVNSPDLLSSGSTPNLTVTKFLESQSATTEEAQTNFSKLTKEAQKLNTAIKAAQGDTEKLGKINFTSFEKVLQNARDSVIELRSQANKGLIDEKVAKNAEEILERIEARFEKIKTQTSQGYTVTFFNKSMLQSLPVINGQLDKTNAKYKEFIKLLQEGGATEAQAEAELERLAQDLGLLGLQTQKQTQRISEMVGGLTSLVFAMQSLTNLGDIITNDDLTTTEKFGQIISSLAIGLPMFASGLKKVFEGTNALRDKLVELVAAKVANKLASKGMITTEAAEEIATVGLSKAHDQNAASIVRENAVKNLANPIMAIALALIVAVTAAILLEAKAHEEEIKNIENANKSTLETIKAKQEERKAYEDTANSLGDLIDQYKEGTISQEEFNNQKAELLANLDAEGRAALNIGNNWKEATRALSTYRANLAKQNAEDAKQSARLSAENALIAADKGVGKYDTTTQTFSNKGYRNLKTGIVMGATGLSRMIRPEVASGVNYLLNKDYNDSLKQIDYFLKDTKTKLDDIIDESGNLQLDVNNPQSIIDFVNAVDKAAQAGVKLDESITKQAAEIRNSAEYATLVESNTQQKRETESKYGADSGIDYAETLEEGQAAYDNFTKNLIEKEGYTLQEANDAWVTYLSGLDTKVATQMVDIQTNFDTMTGAFAKKFQGNFNESKFKAEADQILQYLEDNNLSEGIHLFTPEEWEEMIIGNMSIEEIGQKVAEKLEDSINQSFKDFKEKAGETEDSFQSLIESAISGDVETGEDSLYAKLKSQLDELISYYPELQEEVNTFNNESLIGTQLWIDAVYTLKDAYNDLNFDKLINDYSDKLEKLNNQIERSSNYEPQYDDKGNLLNPTKTVYDDRGFATNQTEVEVIPDTEEFTETMSEIMTADYSITVEVEGDITDEFDNVVDSMENLDDMASKIGEDFIVSAEDITELAAAYPGILEGYQDLGDGTIQLNEEIAKSAMNAASQAEIASTEELVTEIENTNKKLKLKKTHYQTVIEIAQKASKGEINAQQAATDISTELDKIEEINDDLKSEEVENNAADVADNSAINAGIVSDNWGQAYENMASDAIKSAQVAIDAAKAVANDSQEELDKLSSDVSVAWSGGSKGTTSGIDTSTSNYKTGDEATDSDYWQNVIDDAQANIEAIDKAIASNEAMAVEAAARLGSSVTSNSKVGLKESEEDSYSSTENEAETEEYLEREEDLYRAINEELDNIESTLGRIETVQDHSWGLSYQKTLEKQNDLLNEQLDLLEKKKSTYEEDLSSQRAELESQGITFSDDGAVMTNAEDRLNELYAEYNDMVDSYNSMSADAQDSYKDNLDSKKETIEDIEDAIDDYESAFNEYNGVLDEILDTHYELIENAVNQFNAEIDVHLELDEAEQEWNDFWYEVVQDIDDEDFAGKIAQSVGKLNTLIGTVGDTRDSQIAELTDHLNAVTAEVNTQIAAAAQGGGDSLFGDDSALSKENLENYRDKLMEAVRTAKEEIDEMAETYLDALEKAKDLLDDQIEGWEAIGDHIEHNIELIQLVSGEKAYDALNMQFEQQYNNTLKLIEAQRISTEYWQDRMKYYEDMMATEEEGSKMYQLYADALEKASENYQNAVKDLDAAVQNALKDLEEWRDSQVDAITDTLDKALSKNMGLEDLKKQWDLVVETQDYYLDNVERAMEMEGLKNEFNDVLDGMDARNAKQKEFLEFQNEELAKLNEKNKLTQYDIDEVKARLEIKKQELALEEAQQNKSNLRLRRDSQGNYTYQYTANEDQVEEAEDGLLTAKKEWYELVKRRNEETTNEVIDIRKRLMDAEKEMADALAQHDEDAYNNAKDRYNTLIQYEKDIMGEAEKTKRDFYQGTADFFADVNDAQILPMWDTTVQTMIDEWDNGGEDSFIGAVTAGVTNLEQLEIDFGNKTEEILNTAGVNYQDLVNDGIDPTTESLEDMVDTNEELNDTLNETNDTLSQMESELQAAIDAYESLKDAAVDAIQSANDALNTLANTAIETVQQVQAAISAAESAANNIKSNANSYINGNNTQGDGTDSSGEPDKHSYTIVGDPNGVSGTYGVKDTTAGVYVGIYGSLDDAKKKLQELQGNDTYKSNSVSTGNRQTAPTNIQSFRRSSFTLSSRRNARRYTTFATGGYTGEWSDDTENGRLAVLHQKELVLNESDTSNILSAVQAVRDIVSSQSLLDVSGITESIGQISAMQASMLAQISAGMLNSIASTINNNSDVSNYRNMTVNADFSGVRSADAIYQALMELENYGAQQAYSSAPHANKSY